MSTAATAVQPEESSASASELAATTLPGGQIGGTPEARSVSASTSPATTSQAAIPEKRPRLGRLDNEPIAKEELPNRRFGIEIKSVYFFKTATSTRCAINLKTSFELQGSDRFHAAHVPLNASPIGRGAAPDEVEIKAHYPPETEYAEVGRQSGWKDHSTAPEVGVSSPIGVGFKVAGMGVRKQTEIDKSHRVSLDPTIQSLENQPTYLNWKYEALNRNFFYPKAVELLVVVDKPSMPGADPEEWFPFELRLNKELKVSTHGALDRIRSFVAARSQHDGWCFQISGQWNSDIARKFVDDLEKVDYDFEKVQSSIGLRAAVKSWNKAKGGSTRYEAHAHNASEINTSSSTGDPAYIPSSSIQDNPQTNIPPIITEV